MTDWKELEKKYYMQVVNRVPVTLVRGEGVRVWDDNGNEYLDLVAGWAVNSLGHAHPIIAEALCRQAKTLIQTSNQFYTIPQIELAQLLVENSCFDKVFICNSGLEANEGAVKLARRYGHLKLNGAYEVITVYNSFHGRSLAMTAATGQEKFHKPYEPLPAGFINVAYNDINAIKVATNEKTCAIMLEPVQGEGGVNVPAEGYLQAVRDWCNEKGILLIFDEIQTGVHRLGPLWGYQEFGVEPDIMSIAKGLGGGVPIGALLAKQACAVFAIGEHGSTFGGNPLNCSAAYAVMKYLIENNFTEHVKKVGAHMMNGLKKLQKKYPFIVDVRGRGLLLAIQFNSDMSQDILQRCLKEGLLVNAVKPNAIRIMPPLIITEKEIDKAIGIFDKVFSGIKS